MSKRVPLESRAWTPRVGMNIQYRKDVLIGKGVDPEVVATILNVLEDGTIEVRRNKGKRRNVFLRRKTWLSSWEPTQDNKETVSTIQPILSENDVRRIVREELAEFARKAESVVKSALDDLFDSL